MTSTEATPATKTLHYRGDRTGIDMDSFIGGDGQFFRPTAAVYNAETDRTAIEYQQVPLHEMDERYGHKRDAMLGAVEHLGSQW